VIAISLNGETLILGTEAGDLVLQGVHRAYFETILNLRMRTADPGYEATAVDRPGDLLHDICEYLDREHLKYELDENAQRLLQRARGAAQQLALAIAAGNDVLARPQEELRIGAFARDLLPHQWTPVRHLLAVPHAANFSVMGAGKTTVVLAAFHELQQRDVIDCLLVIGPGSSFMPWEEEARICLGRQPRAVRLTGTPDEREARYRTGEGAELLLVTYHTAVRDQHRLAGLMRRRRTMLVLDESHYVKGSGAIADAVLSLAPEAERRVILTGTPVPNNYSDLWTQFTFLWPDQYLLGNRVQFRNQIATPEGEDEARRRLRPLFTRVRKSDLGLPQPRFRPIEVQMGTIQRRIYQALSARTLQELGLQPPERVLFRQWRRAKMVRLLQAASNPSLIAEQSTEFVLPPESGLDQPLLALIQNYSRYEVPPKLLAAIELVRRLVEQGERVIVWTHFVRNIETLLPYLQEFEALPLYGDVPREEADDEDYNRELHIRRFRDDGDPCRVLLANPGAAAESVSLHRVCHNAVYLDRTFNAGQFMQSRDRIHRVGLRQDEQVTYHLLIARDTIDQTVHARLQAKEQRMLNLLDDPNIPVVDMPVSTDQLSGAEDEEDLDFEAVIRHLRETIATHR
jgi:SNF2 family DNA or RNA helicase